jgi:hypothetical protein
VLVNTDQPVDGQLKPKEWVMSNEFTKLLGAGALTLAVVGGAAAYLTSSLAQKPVHYVADSYTIEQPQPAVRHAEVVVTEGRA